MDGTGTPPLDEVFLTLVIHWKVETQANSISFVFQNNSSKMAEILVL